MSGGGSSSSSDWRPAPQTGSGQSDPCAIVELTVLNSPDRSVLATLAAGTLLDVVYQAGPPQQLLAQIHGQTAGSITSPSMLQIIRCIGQGRVYVAEVVTVRGAICQVTVRAR
jgi:hypothetical protein